MANTIDILKRGTLGDKTLVVAKVTGDGSTTSITAASVGLSYIEFLWDCNVDDTASVKYSPYYGTSVTLAAAIANTKIRLIYFVGY